MGARILMVGAYLFLLGVLLPHTAWMFSLFEPEQATQLGWAAAVAFELTILSLTHFLAKELAAVSDINGERFTARLKRELANIPAFLLLASIAISTVANWTHAYQFASTSLNNYAIVKVFYSILFGAALPLCSFAYAYVLSRVYRKPEASTADQEEALGWLALANYVKNQPGKTVTPQYLGRMAGISETSASKVLAHAVETGMINTNGTSPRI